MAGSTTWYVIRDGLGGYAVRDPVDGWLWSPDPRQATRLESARLASLVVVAGLRGAGPLRVEEAPPDEPMSEQVVANTAAE